MEDTPTFVLLRYMFLKTVKDVRRISFMCTPSKTKRTTLSVCKKMYETSTLNSTIYRTEGIQHIICCVLSPVKRERLRSCLFDIRNSFD